MNFIHGERSGKNLPLTNTVVKTSPAVVLKMKKPSSEAISEIRCLLPVASSMEANFSLAY